MSERKPAGTGLSRRRWIGLFGGPSAALLVALTFRGAPSPEAPAVGALAAWMAVWWITEAAPISATALLPLALFPVCGVAPIKEAAAPYANPVIFLFLGGFLLAEAVARWGLHRRVALGILHVVGTRPHHVIGGFMLATAFLSMWVSNTATAVMMLPIAVSAVQLTRDSGRETDPNFAVAMMLGIAYAASVGGMGTLVGTPPNALLAGFLEETFGIELGFAQWMAIGVPVVTVQLPIIWFVITRWIFPVRRDSPVNRSAILAWTEELGAWNLGEKVAGAVFLVTALAWMMRPFLAELVPGLSDAGIAILAGLVLFVLPVDRRRGEFALAADSLRNVPWDVLVLFGGGLSLASAISSSGLAGHLGEALSGFDQLPLLVTMLLVTIVMIFLTELTSNTASTATFLPILASLAIGIGEDPLLIVLPATLAASCAFMMPVATPPNAIVYGAGFVRIPQMARAGLVLNLLFAVLIPLLVVTWGAWWLGAEPGVLPQWAEPSGK